MCKRNRKSGKKTYNEEFDKLFWIVTSAIYRKLLIKNHENLFNHLFMVTKTSRKLRQQGKIYVKDRSVICMNYNSNLRIICTNHCVMINFMITFAV